MVPIIFLIIMAGLAPVVLAYLLMRVLMAVETLLFKTRHESELPIWIVAIVAMVICGGIIVAAVESPTRLGEGLRSIQWMFFLPLMGLSVIASAWTDHEHGS